MKKNDTSLVEIIQKIKEIKTDDIKKNQDDLISFTLSEKETKDAKKWIKKHQKKCPYSFRNGNLPTLGEHYYYKFIPNGLGTLVTVGCCYCNECANVTDTTDW